MQSGGHEFRVPLIEDRQNQEWVVESQGHVGDKLLGIRSTEFQSGDILFFLSPRYTGSCSKKVIDYCFNSADHYKPTHVAICLRSGTVYSMPIIAHVQKMGFIKERLPYHQPLVIYRSTSKEIAHNLLLAIDKVSSLFPKAKQARRCNDITQSLLSFFKPAKPLINLSFANLPNDVRFVVNALHQAVESSEMFDFIEGGLNFTEINSLAALEHQLFQGHYHQYFHAGNDFAGHVYEVAKQAINAHVTNLPQQLKQKALAVFTASTRQLDNEPQLDEIAKAINLHEWMSGIFKESSQARAELGDTLVPYMCIAKNIAERYGANPLYSTLGDDVREYESSMIDQSWLRIKATFTPTLSLFGGLIKGYTRFYVGKDFNQDVSEGAYSRLDKLV